MQAEGNEAQPLINAVNENSKNSKVCASTGCKICIFTFATCTIIIGVLAICMTPGFVKTIIDQNFILRSNSSPGFKLWETTPIPLHMDIYFFNWTNPQDFKNSKIKPKFEEIGPYVFLEKRHKTNIKFKDNNTLISFNNVKTWYFEADKSVGTLDDIITGPNFISNVIAHQTRNNLYIIKKGINLVLNQFGSISKTTSVRKWLFDGYPDPLLKTGKIFHFTDMTKFAWFLNKNASAEAEGNYTMKSGVGDSTHMGQLVSWNGQNHTKDFPGECGLVNGSTGDLWPLDMDINKGLTIFAPDMCRYFNLETIKKTNLMNIEGVAFMSDNKTLPGETCFCKSGEICKQGVTFAGGCKGDVPLYLSFPHFYSADQSFREAIDGMKPNESEHRFEFILEPRLGVPLKVNAPFQLNARFTPDKDYDLYKGIKDTLIPVLWMRERGGVNETLAGSVRVLLNINNLAFVIGWIMASIGCIILLMETTKYLLGWKRGYSRIA